MMRAFTTWLESKPFERRIQTLTLTLDPIGFAAGYPLTPSVGVDPIMGGVYGPIAASLPLSVWVLRHAEGD